jgi:hypothetical protein
MPKRHLNAPIIVVSALSLVIAIAAVPLFILPKATHANMLETAHANTLRVTPTSTPPQKQRQSSISTINGLTHMSIVGSTQFILDKGGHTAAVDPNPYDVQIVPPITNTLANAPSGSVHTGDLIATNIGNADKGNILVLFPARVGPGHQFNTPHAAFSGLAKEEPIGSRTLAKTTWKSSIPQEHF